MTRSQRRRAQRLRAAELLAAGIQLRPRSHFQRGEVVRAFVGAAIEHRPVRVSWRTVACGRPEGWTSYQEGAR